MVMGFPNGANDRSKFIAIFQNPSKQHHKSIESGSRTVFGHFGSQIVPSSVPGRFPSSQRVTESPLLSRKGVLGSGPLNVEGSIHLVFLEVYDATAKTYKTHVVLKHSTVYMGICKRIPQN